MPVPPSCPSSYFRGPFAMTCTSAYTVDPARLDGVMDEPLFKAVAAEAASQ